MPSINTATILVAALIFSAALAAHAASNDCVSKLVGCAGYLNSTTTPPDTCCGPLKETAKNELACLCAIFNSPDLLSTFNVNVTKAIQMAKRCGVTTDQSACAATSKSAAAPSAGSGAASSTPSSASSDTGSPSTKGSANSAHSVTRLGYPGFVILLLSLWSLIA